MFFALLKTRFLSFKFAHSSISDNHESQPVKWNIVEIVCSMDVVVECLMLGCGVIVDGCLKVFDGGVALRGVYGGAAVDCWWWIFEVSEICVWWDMF